MVLFGIPNSGGFHRLGIAIGRKSGPAATRTRLKRLSREAFRLLQHELPHHDSGGYDFVISIRPAPKPGKPVELDQCLSLLRSLATEVHDNWQKRRQREQSK